MRSRKALNEIGLGQLPLREEEGEGTESNQTETVTTQLKKTLNQTGPGTESTGPGQSPLREEKEESTESNRSRTVTSQPR